MLTKTLFFLIVLLQGVLLFYIYDGTSQILDLAVYFELHSGLEKLFMMES